MREGNLAQPQLTVENRLANKRKHVVLMVAYLTKSQQPKRLACVIT